LGLSAAAASVGINAEAGGTAFSTAFAEIFSAIAEGGDSLKVFATTAGLTVTEFSNLFRTNAVEALIRFSEGVNKSALDGKNFQATLDAVGLGGIRTTDAILKMGNASDMFRQAQSLANAEMQTANALNDEFAKRQATSASQMILLTNNIEDLKITFGDKFLPLINNFVQAVIPMIARIGDIVISLDNFDKKLRASQAESQAWVQSAIDGFNRLGPSLGQTILDMQTKITGSWGTVWTNANSAWTNIKTMLVEKWTDLKATASGWFDALVETVRIKWGLVWSGANTAWTNIKTLLVEKWTDIKSTASGWFDALVETIRAKWGLVWSGAATAWTNIKNLLVTRWNDIKATAGTIFNALADAIGSAFDRVSAIVTSKWATIKNAFAKGIEAVKAVLNIGSPSKVFIDIGMQVGKGFEIGVAKSLGGIEVPFKEVMPAARGALMRSEGQTGMTTNRSASMNLVQNFQTMSNPEEIRRQSELAMRRFALEFPIR
jgi:phage-related protein